MHSCGNIAVRIFSKGLKFAQLLGQLGGFLACVSEPVPPDAEPSSES
jgi:hypothetical protein